MTREEARFLAYFKQISQIEESNIILHLDGACECGWQLPIYMTVALSRKDGTINMRQAKQSAPVGYCFACPQCEKRVVRLHFSSLGENMN
jgi:hypothetical protein